MKNTDLKLNSATQAVLMKKIKQNGINCVDLTSTSHTGCLPGKLHRTYIEACEVDFNGSHHLCVFFLFAFAKCRQKIVI